jgi:hypothetical protein
MPPFDITDDITGLLKNTNAYLQLFSPSAVSPNTKEQQNLSPSSIILNSS